MNPSRLTRRQSQRPHRSCLVLSFLFPNRSIGLSFRRRHESRPLWPWLIFDVSPKEHMRLITAEELAPSLRHHLPRIAGRLAGLLPDTEFHHIGATAIPGSLTKGDVDVLLRVEEAGFTSAIEILRQHFTTKQPQNWTDSFASFGDDRSYPFPLGVQLVIKNSESDFFLFLHEYFTLDSQHLAEYNRIKKESAPLGAEEYWKAKNRFLGPIIAARPKQG